MVNGVLEELFERRQQVLEAELRPQHATAKNPTAKGDHSELRWHNMLRSFLPDRYSIGKGEIVDSQGGRSEQIDLIIYDRLYTPPLVDEEFKVLPVESVYAAFEIKPALDKASFQYASKKAGTIRALKPSNTPLGVPTLRDPIRRTSPRIITGLLTHRSETTKPVDKFNAWSGNSYDSEQLDLVCCLTDGSFELSSENGHSTARASAPESSLVWFCVRLFERVRQVGTAAPVDLNRYLDSARRHH